MTPRTVAPGMDVTLQVNVANLGTAPLNGGVVILELPDILRDLRLAPSTGITAWQGAQLVWNLAELAPGAEAALTLQAAVSADALPDGAIAVRASLAAPASYAMTQEMALDLPWAPLPAAGP